MRVDRGSTDMVREAQPSSEPERQQLILSVQSEREDRKWSMMVGKAKCFPDKGKLNP